MSRPKIAAIGIAALIVIGTFIACYDRRHELFGLRTSSLDEDGSAPVSVELADAPPGPTARRRVLRWLHVHRAAIVANANHFNVTCIAVGGAIAFEAIADPMWTTLDGFARWIGPGKVHYKQYYAAEGNPIARQVETAGFLHRRTLSDRKAALATGEGASAYIAAIMRAFADRVDISGTNVAQNPAILGTLYSGWELRTAAARFGGPPRALAWRPNRMGSWISENNAALNAELDSCNARRAYSTR